MKAILLLFFSLFVLSTSAQVYPYSTPPPPPTAPPVVAVVNAPDAWGAKYFHFGLNFTTGVYWLTPGTSDNSANGAAFGYGYGANLEFYFTRNYAFLLGMEISNTGANYTNTSVDSSVRHNKTIQYLQLPLELKLKTVPFRHIRYYGLIGLDLGILLKATDNSNTIDYLNSSPPIPIVLKQYSDNNVPIYSQTDFFRASFVIGGGFEYTLAGSSALQASLTYNNCLTNLNSNSGSVIKMKGIELMLGVLF